MEILVDLRSDTVTKPTPQMLQAMLEAPVGDDVLGDDPTVQLLESEVAQITGHQAAVFVPSGTMGNQIAIASHTSPGDSILAEDQAHILYYEVAAPAVLSQVLTRTITTQKGIIDPSDIEKRFLTNSLHTPGTTLLCLENTHNRAGGTVTSLDLHAKYSQIAKELNIKIHLDGARVWNAATALDVPVVEITQHVDSVSVCLSKALGAPVGSVLTGSQDLIDKARIWRKRLGGGMRQSGILAAAGLYALKHHYPLLTADHQRTAKLAQALANIPGLRPTPPETNILMVTTDLPAQQWVDTLAGEGIACFPMDPHRLRFVFHHQVTDDHLHHTINTFQKLSH